MILRDARRLGRAATAALAIGWLAGTLACTPNDGLVPVGSPEPDRYLYERGAEELEDGDWFDARPYFEQIWTVYPQSAFRPQAKIGLGETYMVQGGPSALVRAVAEFQEFLTFFPTHPQAPYAQYQIGLAHHRQMLSPDRDQTQTRLAIEAFERFVELYPNSDLMPQLQEQLREARDRLSESEFRVGQFYYRRRWLPGAIDRFRSILDNDPQFGGRDGVYYYLAEALIQLDRSAEALPYFERLVAEFEQSEFLEAAAERINELNGSG